MAKHQYARPKKAAKAEKAKVRRASQHAIVQINAAKRRENSPKPSAYTYRGCDITRNTGGPDNQRWMASKPSAKDGFAPVHIGDFATIGAAQRAIDGFKAAIRG